MEVLDQQLTGVSREIRNVLRLDSVYQKAVSNYEAAAAQIKLRINGKALQKLGVPKGPEIGNILRKVRLAWLEQRIKTSDEENEFVLRLVEQRRM
ncbi:hypothetical protein SDC9_188390 [bioreactor metagenome]|uniref:CCA-adding enzyme C-terminal domain-containing protein n=1 Tax=bioreactor metagenome TaxID=1076179 RepID=A0A645HPT1_9ZZZZ